MASRSIGSDEQIRIKMFEAMATHPDLDGVDLRVFLFLASKLNFDEFVTVPQLEIAAALERRKEHISRSIKKLIEAGVLLASPNGTRSSEWRFKRGFGS